MMKNMMLVAIAVLIVPVFWLFFKGNSNQSPEIEPAQYSQTHAVKQTASESEKADVSTGLEIVDTLEAATNLDTIDANTESEANVENGEIVQGSGPRGYLPPAFNQSEAILINDPNDPEQLAEEAKLLRQLDLPEDSSIENLHVLLASLSHNANQGAYPTGDNIEVTNALLGRNYRKVAYLPQDHPRINEVGEFIDPWGSAYHFHFESSSNVTISSAGPDRELYTADDIVGTME